MAASATSKLDILINAKNNASPQVKQLTRDLGGLENLAGLAGKALSGIAAGFTIAGIKGLVDMGMELSRTAAYAQDVETAFESLASKGGRSAEELFAALKKGSSGTINDFELMLTANRAMLLGVGGTAEEIGKLMDTARVRSNAMGLTTQQAFNDIVTGIGRNSAQILDNLGIVIDTDLAYQKYADSLGKTTAALTDQERKQAMINAVIADTEQLVNDVADSGGDAASHFERMDAALTNAKAAMGELFQPAMVIVAQAIADAADAAAEGMKNMTGEAVQARQEASVLEGHITQLTGSLAQQTNVLNQMRDAGMEGSDTYQQVAARVQELSQQLAIAKGQHDGLIPSIELAAQDFEFVGITAEQARAAIAAAGDAADSTAGKLINVGLEARLAAEGFNAIFSQSTKLQSMIDSAAASGGVLFGKNQGDVAGLTRQGEIAYELERQQAAWEEMGYSQKEIADVLMPAYIQNLQEVDRKTFQVASGTKTISEEAREAERAFNDLKSTVEGVLRGALDTGVDVDPDEVLEKLGIPRADAINENARRLADIAQNGLKGQDWLGNFAKEVPDIWRMIRTAQNPQEEAAYLLRDFQDGLLTSAIDRNKAKDIVRRAILGDRKMAEMAQEIAEELAAEMGIPLQEALAATKGALGSGSGTEAGFGVGESVGEAAVQGVSQNSSGTRMVEEMLNQVKLSYESLRISGSEAGKVWGQGFIAVVRDNVPFELISILTDLVTPEVMAKFAQQGTLTGSVTP